MLNPIDSPPDVPGAGHPPRSRSRSLLVVALLLLAMAAAAMPFDLPVGRWFLDTFPPLRGDRVAAGTPGWLVFLTQILRFSEAFGHAAGVILIVCVIFQLDPTRRWGIPRLVTVTLCSGLAVDVLKLLVSRTRPYSFDFAGSVWDTFGGWLPLGRLGSTFQSLPSGHTGAAVGLAAALVWLYPRGVWIFSTLAALVACQRVQVGAHWPSDVLVGGAVGCLVAIVCLYAGPIPRVFGRWEPEWKMRDEEREMRRRQFER